MAGVPRSLVLVLHRFTGASESAYFTCPENVVTLVKDFHIHNQHTIAAFTSVFLANVGYTPPFVSLFAGDVAVGGDMHWTGFAVLNPGMMVVAQTAYPNVDVWISGAALMGPPPFPPGSTAVLADVTPLPA